MTRRSRRTFLGETAALSGSTALAALAGCAGPGGDAERDWVDARESEDLEPIDPGWTPAEGVPREEDVEPTTAIADLEVPWDLEFAGEDAFVTEREGGLRRFTREELREGDGLNAADGDVVLAADDLPDRVAPGEGGTLGVAADPDYPNPPAVYCYYTADNGGATNRVVRYDLERETLDPVVEGIPGARIHDGGRIEFGPDGALWIATGDADEVELAQDPSSLAGSVLRVGPYGDAAPGNPDFGADADPRTYTIGHRNPQGLAFTPDGTPLVAEHGPEARDEASILEAGGNYGWPDLRGGPDDPRYGSYGAVDEVVPPLVNTGPRATWAPSGASFYADDAIAGWEHRPFVAGLVSRTLFAVTLVDGDATAAADLVESGVAYDASWLDGRFTAVANPLFADEFGRLRHVERGPGGALYLLTSNRDGRASGEFPTRGDDRIVRLEPAEVGS